MKNKLNELSIPDDITSEELIEAFNAVRDLEESPAMRFLDANDCGLYALIHAAG